MALEEQCGRDSIHAQAPLLSAHATCDQGLFRSRGGKALVDELHRECRRLAKPARKLLRSLGFRTVPAVEPQRKADDDPGHVVCFRDLRQPRREGRRGLRRLSREGLRNCPARVAYGEADALRPRIHRQSSHLVVRPGKPANASPPNEGAPCARPAAGFADACVASCARSVTHQLDALPHVLVVSLAPAAGGAPCPAVSRPHHYGDGDVLGVAPGDGVAAGLVPVPC